MRSTLRLLSVTALTMSAACGDRAGSGSDSTSSGDAAAPGGTVVVALAGQPDVIFHALSATAPGHMLSSMLFDRLAAIGDDMNTVGASGFGPQLARRWTWAPDSLSIAFELDPDARFHDGRPVRAADVKFSHAISVDPAVGALTAGALENLDSVQVRDSLTPVLWFKRRSPQQFFDVVQNLMIVPEHVYGAVPRAQLKTSELMRRPVGSGRFRFVRWDAGARMEVVSDTANYRGRAKLDRVIFTITPDLPSAVARLTAGEADFLETVLPGDVERVENTPNYRVFAYPNTQTAFMGMNLRTPRGSAPHPIFSDARVRRAMSMAVDRRAMLQNVFGARGKLGFGPFPRSHSVADTTLVLPAFDTLGAAALLDSAGWTRGADGMRSRAGRPLRFSLVIPRSSQPRMAYSVLLQAQLRRIGAAVELEPLEFAAFMARVGSHDFDAAMQAFNPEAGPGGIRERWGGAAAVQGQNSEGYRNPRVDAQLDSALASYNPASVRRHMRAAYDEIVSDAPAIWLYDVLTLAGAHERIIIPSMPATGWWGNFAEWSIPPDRRLPRDRIGVATTPTP